MENMIFIGTKIDKASREEMTEFIKEIFQSGQLTEMSGKTIRHALSMFHQTVTPQNLTVENCNFTNNPEKSED